MHTPHESIFLGSVRSFFRALFALLGISLGCGIIVILSALVLGSNYYPIKTEPIIAPNAEGERTPLSSFTPVILRIDLHGEIGKDDLTTEKFESLLIDSRSGFLGRDRVKGILLHLDTPGGSVIDTDGIYRALLHYKERYQVPVYAYIDGFCASGGMYVACAADQIHATYPSVIGSVGVLMRPAFNFFETMNKVGVSALTLTEGKDKDALNPFRAWKPNEESSLKGILSALYERFVTIVSTARPKLTKEELVQEYGAHVFIAEKAAALGYIDKAGSDYSIALQALLKAANLLNVPYQVVQLKLKHSLLEEITRNHFLKSFSQWIGIAHSEEGFKNNLLYLYQP